MMLHERCESSGLYEWAENTISTSASDNTVGDQSKFLISYNVYDKLIYLRPNIQSVCINKSHEYFQKR